MNTQKMRTKGSPLISLAVLSTLIAELLSGSTPFSRIGQLSLQFLLYGSGAILVREITRRLGLGWKTILLLGLSFGIILEGLVLQSIFNPHFLGLDIAFGRALGVNWVWAEYLTGLHCFWSIACAILVTEMIFYEDRNEPWVGLTGLKIIGAIYILISVGFHFLFVRIFHFQAAPILYLYCGLLVILLVVIALRLPREAVYIRNGVRKTLFSFWVIALITCVAGVLWFMGIGMIMSTSKVSLWIAIPAGPLVTIVYFALVNKWGPMAIRSNIDKLAVSAGLLGTDLVLGYTGTLGNKLDHYGQIGLIILTLTLLALLFKKVRKSDFLATV